MIFILNIPVEKESGYESLNSSFLIEFPAYTSNGNKRFLDIQHLVC
jgi:hypothetical protein